MAERNILKNSSGESAAGTPERGAAPLGGTRAESTQRLQVGLSGIAAMVLLVGLASIIGNQAEQTEQEAVPDAAPTTEPTEAPAQRDPLADAGVVPDIPADPTPTATPDVDVAPGQPPNGSAAPADVEPSKQ